MAVWNNRKPVARPNERRVQRDICDLVTSITRGTDLRISGRVIDICVDGCCLRSETYFTRGDRIRVLLPVAGDVEARVVWSMYGAFGCHFGVPIDGQAYPRLLGAIKARHHDWEDNTQSA